MLADYVNQVLRSHPECRIVAVRKDGTYYGTFGQDVNGQAAYFDDSLDMNDVVLVATGEKSAVSDLHRIGFWRMGGMSIRSENGQPNIMT